MRMSSLRVLEVIRTSTGARWIEPELTELLRRGHEVAAVVPDAEGQLGARLARLGVTVESSVVDLSNPASVASSRNLSRLRRQLTSFHPDLVYYQLIQTAVAVRLASVGSGVRRIHRVPGPLYLESRPVRLAERLLCKLDDLIICGSRYTRDLYASLGVPRSRLAAVPFGVNVTKFRRDETVGNAYRDMLGLPRDSYVAVMVAYSYPPKRLAFPGRGVKGHETLIQAWSNFSFSHAGSYLVFVSDGWGPHGEEYRRSLERLAHSHSRPGSVLWLTRQPDVRPFYSMADVSISPSWSENHGASLEAGAMSVPSIVSSAGGLPEAVTKDSGWLFHPGDVRRLEQLLRCAFNAHQDGSLVRMGLAAREFIESRFDSRVCATRVADQIEALRA